MKKLIIFCAIIILFNVNLSFAGDVNTVPAGLISIFAGIYGSLGQVANNTQVYYVSESQIRAQLDSLAPGCFSDGTCDCIEIQSESQTTKEALLYFIQFNPTLDGIANIYLNQDFYSSSMTITDTEQGRPPGYQDVLAALYTIGNDQVVTGGMSLGQYAFLIGLLGIICGEVFCRGLNS